MGCFASDSRILQAAVRIMDHLWDPSRLLEWIRSQPVMEREMFRKEESKHRAFIIYAGNAASLHDTPLRDTRGAFIPVVFFCENCKHVQMEKKLRHFRKRDYVVRLYSAAAQACNSKTLCQSAQRQLYLPRFSDKRGEKFTQRNTRLQIPQHEAYNQGTHWSFFFNQPKQSFNYSIWFKVWCDFHFCSQTPTTVQTKHQGRRCCCCCFLIFVMNEQM